MTAEWNTSFNKERRTKRKACIDLQNLIVHRPEHRIRKLPPERTKIGLYPVILVPGQFSDYYKR